MGRNPEIRLCIIGAGVRCVNNSTGRLVWESAHLIETPCADGFRYELGVFLRRTLLGVVEVLNVLIGRANS